MRSACSRWPSRSVAVQKWQARRGDGGVDGSPHRGGEDPERDNRSGGYPTRIQHLKRGLLAVVIAVALLLLGRMTGSLAFLCSPSPPPWSGSPCEEISPGSPGPRWSPCSCSRSSGCDPACVRGSVDARPLLHHRARGCGEHAGAPATSGADVHLAQGCAAQGGDPFCRRLSIIDLVGHLQAKLRFKPFPAHGAGRLIRETSNAERRSGRRPVARDAD